jgi:heme exporter protein C
MAKLMLAGMLVMAFAAWFYAIAIALLRVQAIILERERATAWVGELAASVRGAK